MDRATAYHYRDDDVVVSISHEALRRAENDNDLLRACPKNSMGWVVAHGVFVGLVVVVLVNAFVDKLAGAV